MDIRITGAPKGGTVRAIPSKSAAHRLLIAAALSGADLLPYCDGLSQDISATKTCLQRMLGVKEAGAKQTGAKQTGTQTVQLPCRESGSTLRFLIPLTGALGIDADFLCEGRLPDRPMEPFLKVLAEHGCEVTGRNPKKLRGRLSGGDFRLPGDISSQYVTGLLMALPLAEKDSCIIVGGTLQSRPYVDLTLQVLYKAGIQVLETTSADGTVFEVQGRQNYQLSVSDLEQVEGDWSNGAFWLVMDAMLRGLAPSIEGSSSSPGDCVIRCEGLDPESVQGDRAIVDIIERIKSADSMLYLRNKDSLCPGRRSIPSGNAADRLDISVSGRCGFVELDVSDIPDLVPIMAALACSRPVGAVTHIIGAERLRFKESDRLYAVTRTLTALGGDITEEPAGLMIRGTGTLDGGEVDSFGDHRIAMMAAAAACIAREDIIIRGAEAVDKSYPGFFDDYRKLGGRWELAL